MAEQETGLFVNWVLSLLLKKIVVPSDFHDQADAVEVMLQDDISGLVDSLTDFAVDSATVDFDVSTKNDKFTSILKQWLNEINSEYQGKIPMGVKPLAKEYFKERWKGSSFPVLKITKWKKVKGINVPSGMFFVKGASIYAKDIDTETENLKLFNYDYYLGKTMEDKLDKGVIFTKPYGRWFDKYPTPYLIKRGIYHNWKIIQSLKNKETEILDQIIPYLMLVKKGTEGLATSGTKTYSQPELQKTVDQFKQLVNDMETLSGGGKKLPFRATNFDEEIKHIIPDLSTIFNRNLFEVAERNILAGLGFVDVIEAVSTSRRESILNPKVFIEEVRTGVEDFRQLLKQLIVMIIDKNKDHPKYINNDFYITASPVKAFMTDEFKEKIRQLYDRGRISSQTAVELVGEVDFETEVYRREQEAKRGIDETLYPPVRENREGQGIDLPSDFEQPKDTDEEEIPDDKKDKIEKENYDIGHYEAPVKCSKCGNTFDMLAEVEIHMGEVECPKCGGGVTQKDLLKQSKEKDLVISPYRNVKSLPPRVKDNLDADLQGVFLRVFNNAFKLYDNETRAFRVAWSIIRKIGRKGKDGKWHRRRSRVKGKLKPVKVDRAMIESALEETEQEIITETMQLKELEIKEKKNKLLDILLKSDKKNKTTEQGD